MFRFNISLSWMFIAGLIVLILLSGCAAEPIKPVTVPITFNEEEIRIMIEEGGVFTIQVKPGISVAVSIEPPINMDETYET